MNTQAQTAAETADTAEMMTMHSCFQTVGTLARAYGSALPLLLVCKSTPPQTFHPRLCSSHSHAREQQK